MRLLRSDSQEVMRQLTAAECVCARDLLADFPAAFVGSIAIVTLALLASVFAELAATITAGGFALILWIGFFIWRGSLTKRTG